LGERDPAFASDAAGALEEVVVGLDHHATHDASNASAP
jgi:hypothetical protein